MPLEPDGRMMVLGGVIQRNIHSSRGDSASPVEAWLDEAQALLRRTNLSVTEVGGAVGIHDPSHFTRTFKQLTGLTPSAFRTAVRQKGFRVSKLPD